MNFEKKHLARLNIAQLQAPLDSPQLSDFAANLDRINALAENSDGFVWRLVTEEGKNATDVVHPFCDDVIVNMSVWDDFDELLSTSKFFVVVQSGLCGQDNR